MVKLSAALCLMVLMSIFSGVAAYAQGALLPHFKKSENYRTVRIKMLKAGWKPYHTADADVCDEGDERCQGRPEMDKCSGTGLAFCTFIWKRKGRTAVIQTVGEHAALESYSVR